MLTKDDLKQIAELMDKRFTEQETRFDLKLDEKLKKAFRGVVRKKDLRAMENRFMKKTNAILDHCDGRLLIHDQRFIRIEKHLHFPSSAS